MAFRTTTIFFLGAGIFASTLAMSAAMQSCDGSQGNADGNPYGNPMGPCDDGTYQLASCLAIGDGGAQLEPFSDEACIGLANSEMRAPATMDDSQAPAIDAPVQGQVLARATPIEFAWHATGLSGEAPRKLPLTRAFAWYDDIERWTAIVPRADAHCPPFGGLGYAVIFQANGMEILRAETSHLTYTPSATAWSHLQTVAGTISMTVEAALFFNDQVNEGPYVQTTPRAFTIGP